VSIRALLVGVALAVIASGPALRTEPASRSIVVLSDLHMGSGRDSSRQWLPQERFRWSKEFAEFLKSVSRTGNNAVDLVLNGDTFEILRTPEDACGADSPDEGCTEAGAVARLDQLLKTHAGEIDALAEFARTGSNHVTFVPGDRDAALLFGRVQRRLLSAIDAPREKVATASAGYWLSPDGQVFVEHGHQVGFSPHRLDRWPAPFVKRSGADRLVRSWGERLLAELEAAYQGRFPAVAHVAALGTGFKYVFALDEQMANRLLPQLLRHSLFSISWQQFRMELDDGDVAPPAWDLERLREQGSAFVAASIPNDDPLKPLVTKALSGGGLDAIQLTDDEIVAVCDYRAAVRRARRRFEHTLTQLAPRGPAVAECPRSAGSRGATYEYFWRSRDLMFSRHLDAIAGQGAAARRPIRVFVYGHTHVPDRAQSLANTISGGLLKIPMEGFSPRRGELTPVVINGGAWMRTMTPVSLERAAADSGRTVAAVLATIRPEELAPCYSFVQISMETGDALPAVRYWRRSAEGQWDVAPACALDP
jgi:UDP-2,3-diacylglucosamine pyrophosphatase LpxH